MSNKNSKSNSAATRDNCTTLASNDNIKITSFQHIFSADNIFTEIIVTMNNTVDNRLPRKRKSQNFALLQTIIRNLQQTSDKDQSRRGDITVQKLHQNFQKQHQQPEAQEEQQNLFPQSLSSSVSHQAEHCCIS